MLRLAVALSASSLAGMLLIDRALGSRAGLLNAGNAVQRLMGRPATAGSSIVADRVSAPGELAVVIMANALIGTLLASVVRLVAGLAQ